VLLYAITGRTLLRGNEAERAERLAALASDWAGNGVDLIQVRENDLLTPELTGLAAKIVGAVRQSGGLTKVLINASPEGAARIALQSQADGVHLKSGLTREQLVEAVCQIRLDLPNPVISVSCHSIDEILSARAAGVTLALFGPIFEKVLPGSPARTGVGLESLATACRVASQPTPHAPLPILALGGVTLGNAGQCLDAGAAGIAAIRLFLTADSGPGWRRLAAP
jgi:thiamine-phosphate pyrophosphorylase